MRRPSLKNLKFSNEARSKARGGGLREAIIGAAQRLFLERGFGSVSMDDLTAAAGVARRTLYKQFASKEEIFREMLLRVSAQLETAFSGRHQTQADVEDALRLIARAEANLGRYAPSPTVSTLLQTTTERRDPGFGRR
jgi:AcrR family transcriptional regulator